MTTKMKDFLIKQNISIIKEFPIRKKEFSQQPKIKEFLRRQKNFQNQIKKVN